MEHATDYQAQGWDFLSRFSIGFHAKRGKLACPPWHDEKHIHGDHYRITLRKPSRRSITFDFWNSQNDAQNCIEPTPYAVLACISSEAAWNGSFSDFCGEFGYDEDSRSAFKTYQRIERFAERARRFFTVEEIEALQEIS